MPPGREILCPQLRYLVSCYKVFPSWWRMCGEETEDGVGGGGGSQWSFMGIAGPGTVLIEEQLREGTRSKCGGQGEVGRVHGRKNTPKTSYGAHRHALSAWQLGVLTCSPALAPGGWTSCSCCHRAQCTASGEPLSSPKMNCTHLAPCPAHQTNS